MAVMPGYKQTEVGVIPVDWDVRQFADHFRIYAGGDVPKHSLSNTQSPAHPYPIFANALSCRGLYGYTAERRASGNSVTITARGYLGHAEYRNEPFFPIVRLLVLEPNGKLDAQFTAYAINELVEFAIESTGVPQLTAPQVAKYAIASPPTLEDQRAIATALSDVDALLDGLDRLIAKKRDLKQAMMQQLLTGQTRLPGFSGDWEVKRLGEIGSTYGGLTGKTKADFGVGAARYVTFMNVMANVVIDCGAFEAVRVSASEFQNQVNRGDLLFNGSSETPEEVAMCSFMASDVSNLFLNSFCFGFRPRDERQADGLFLTYYLRANPGREVMKSLAQGSTRYNLSKRALLEAPVRLPSKDEQTAIAAVLSDIDAELAALDARRDKTSSIKKAMMQELLTGRTRLV
jgi:type I restriction enzyme S subunit